MLNPAKPFSSARADHRDRRFAIAEVRKRKRFVYVLTDVTGFRDLELMLASDGILSSLDGLTDEKIAESAFYVYFRSDEAAVEPIRRIIGCGGLFIPPMQFSRANYSRISEHAGASLTESDAMVGQLTGEVVLHENICQAVEMTREVDGDFLEIGIFDGSAAVTAMTHLRNLGLRRKCWLMDGFEDCTAPEDGVERTQIAERVGDAGQDFELVKSDICADPLPGGIRKLALVNVGVDAYEETLWGLIKTAPLVQPRGIIICEGPASTPGLYGAFVAMQEFLQTQEGRKFVRVFLGTQYFLIKLAG